MQNITSNSIRLVIRRLCLLNRVSRQNLYRDILLSYCIFYILLVYIMQSLLDADEKSQHRAEIVLVQSVSDYRYMTNPYISRRDGTMLLM